MPKKYAHTTSQSQTPDRTHSHRSTRRDEAGHGATTRGTRGRRDGRRGRRRRGAGGEVTTRRGRSGWHTVTMAAGTQGRGPGYARVVGAGGTGDRGRRGAEEAGQSEGRRPARGGRRQAARRKTGDGPRTCGVESVCRPWIRRGRRFRWRGDEAGAAAGSGIAVAEISGGVQRRVSRAGTAER